MAHGRGRVSPAQCRSRSTISRCIYQLHASNLKLRNGRGVTAQAVLAIISVFVFVYHEATTIVGVPSHGLAEPPLASL